MWSRVAGRSLALVCFLMMVGGAVYAQKATRIMFKKGTSSASVSGKLAAGASRTYVMRAKENQEIQAVVSGKNVLLDNGMLTMSYSTPNGDNYIKVTNHGKTSTNFTMTVSIQ